MCQIEATCLALGGAWLLLRAIVLETYQLREFAVQAGLFACLASMALLARLARVRGPDLSVSETRDHSPQRDASLVASERAAAPDASEFQSLATLRMILSGVLLLACFLYFLWWMNHGAHGMFLLRLRSGLDRATGQAAGLWFFCLIVCPTAPRRESSELASGVRTAANLVMLLSVVWTYPYADPFVKYVQWSGLHLPLVVGLSIWNVVMWLRGDEFVQGWVTFLTGTLLPQDLCIPPHGNRVTSTPSVVWIASICAGAVLVRAAGITSGLPEMRDDREFRPYHPDEKESFEQAWRLHASPEQVVFARGGAAYHRLGAFAKDLVSYFTEPDLALKPQIVLLRCLNLLAVVGYVLLVYLSGIHFGHGVGLGAAAMMALMPGNVLLSLVARPEAIFTCLCCVGLYAALRATSSPFVTHWLGLGSFAMGVAAGTKLTGLGLTAPLLMAVLLDRPAPARLFRHGALMAVAAIAGYFLASYETFFFFDRFQHGLSFMRARMGAKSVLDVAASAPAYLGQISAYAWTPLVSLPLAAAVALALRTRAGLVVSAYIVAGFLISFAQREVTLRSHVHLSSAASLLVADALVIRSRSVPPWMRRCGTALLAVVVVWMAQESVGHIIYLNCGRDARSQAEQWIAANIPADQAIGLTPLYPGEWSSSPPLDEYKRRVVLLPVGAGYDADGYLNKKLDYIVLSDLNATAAQYNPATARFYSALGEQRDYQLLRVFAPSSSGVQLARWMGWPMPYDWLYTRPTLFVYGRRQLAGDASPSAELFTTPH